MLWSILEMYLHISYLRWPWPVLSVVCTVSDLEFCSAFWLYCKDFYLFMYLFCFCPVVPCCFLHHTEHLAYILSILFLLLPVSPLLFYWTLFKKTFWKLSKDSCIFLLHRRIKRMDFVVSAFWGKKSCFNLCNNRRHCAI